MFRILKSLFRGKRRAEGVLISSTSPEPRIEKSIEDKPTETIVPRPKTTVPLQTLKLPVKSFLDRLPPTLMARFNRPPTDADLLALPLGATLGQLARGAVKVTFGDIRKHGPLDLFSKNGDLDSTVVDLPLAAILAQLNPSHLSRRSEQKRVALSGDIGTVFAAKSSPTPKEPAKSFPKVPLAEGQDELQASHLLAHTSSADENAPVSKVAEAKVPGPLKLVSEPTPLLESKEEEPEASGSPKALEPQGHSGEGQTVKVTLASLARSWPDSVKRDILAAHLASSVNLPFDILEKSLASGKAAFPWKQLRAWLTPGAHGSLPEHEEVVLELPLSVLIPPFLARRPASTPSRKLEVSGEQSDVFVVKKAAPVPTSLEKAPIGTSNGSVRVDHTASTASAALLTKVPETKAGGMASEKLSSDQKASSRSNATPAEIVQRACRLTGVAGALVGTSDGLLIASQVTAGLNAETTAAFLPQIFNRLGQYMVELKLENPTQLEVLLGKTPLQIFKTAEVYFAVIGRQAEPLPKIQLSVLANQLSAKTN